MPIAYDLYRQKQHEAVEDLELKEPWPGLMLTRTGMLRGQLVRLLQETTSPSRHVSYLPRNYHIKGHLHHGDIGTVRKSLGEMQMAIVDEGHRPRELFLAYLTCPLCEAEKNGPKVLLIRHWVESRGLQRRQARRTNRPS